MINSRSVSDPVRASNLLASVGQPAKHVILAAAQTRRISAKHIITTGVLLVWSVPEDVIGLDNTRKFRWQSDLA